MPYSQYLVGNRLVFAFLFLLTAVPRANADNDIQGQPAPESAEDILSSFDTGMAGQSVTAAAFDEILEKSQVKLKLRNYYFNRARPDNTDPKAWAQGGSLDYNVDKIGGYFGLKAEYFTSFPLWAPDQNDGTMLLESVQNEIHTLGILNPKATYEGNVLSLYRQRIDLPFVNSQDNRMIPNTFEAYLLGMPKAENEKFQYVIGYISEMKERDVDNFQSMSEVAGVNSVQRGMIASGLRYYPMPELSLAGINYYVEDIINIAYGEGVFKKKIDEDMANTFSVQYADQRSTGDDLLTGEGFSTNFWGVQNAFSYKNITLKTAFTCDDTGADLNTSYGSYPGYNSSIVEDYNRAGEKAWQLGLAYNFARFGLKGLGVSSSFVKGFDAIDPDTKENVPDKDETDVTVDYKVSEGILSGFWVRLRGAFVGAEGGGTTEDYRIIVNYEIPLYEPETTVQAKS